jgi:hypothetical protein
VQLRKRRMYVSALRYYATQLRRSMNAILVSQLLAAAKQPYERCECVEILLSELDAT